MPKREYHLEDTGFGEPFLRAYPNPLKGGGSLRILYSLAGVESGSFSGGEIAVYDLAGRRVRSLVTGGTRNGALSWDGRTGRGVAAAAGIYFIRSSGAGAPGAVRVELIRQER